MPTVSHVEAPKQISPKKRKRRGAGTSGKIGGAKKKIKGNIDEEEEEEDSDDELMEEVLANTPNVKQPMMECELHDGEKIMVSLHHNCKTLDYVELPSSAVDRPSGAKNARAAAAFVDGKNKRVVLKSQYIRPDWKTCTRYW